MPTEMDTDKMNEDVAFGVETINKRLVGCLITEAIVSGDGEMFGFRATRKGQALLVWIDRDSEANGPGWLNIEKDASGG